MRLLRRVVLALVVASRWLFGLSALVIGVAGVAWGPFALARGDGEGFFLLSGGVSAAGLAWLIHPWGQQRQWRLQRQRRLSSGV
jgi:hypothetical protein